MYNAIVQTGNNKYTHIQKNKLLFNGFWRNGDKPNVCMWLDQATWHDAKTGDGGGCKEFAKAAFSMNLTEFMNRYGRSATGSETLDVAKAFKERPPSLPASINKPIEHIFKDLCQRDKEGRIDKANGWLETKRGLTNPRFYIGSGFANLTKEDVFLFESQHQNFIHQRLTTANQMVVPLRGVHSDSIQNLFFRSIGECPKEEKSRLLPNGGGWHDQSETPRAFGFPHLISDFPHLILCEGMADYFAAECLIGCDHHYLPIGAASASALNKWAEWLVKIKYNGRVILLYQLDTNKNGQVSSSGTGQAKATETLKILLTNKIKSRLFNWGRFLKHISSITEIPKDIADLCPVVPYELLVEKFFTELKEVH